MIIIITIKQWPRIRTTHPKTKITKTIKTESKNPEDKSTPLSRESTNASSETEEDQFATIPTSNVTEPSKRESPPTEPRMRDRHIYLNNTTLTIIIHTTPNSIHPFGSDSQSLSL